MSFKCALCSVFQPPKTSPVMVILEAREVTYPERRKKTNIGTKVIDPGGNGTEIVREVMVCDKCAK